MVLRTSVSLNCTADLRKSNRHNVAMEIYHQPNISKQEIARKLELSLPTVTQNLTELEASGLIHKNGTSKSTGGRKANVFEIIATSKMAIGFFLQKKSYCIVAIDLYGNVVFSQDFSTPFEYSREYFSILGNTLNLFIRENGIGPQNILGVNIALEALVTKDHASIAYSEVYKCDGLTLAEIQEFIPYPCKFYHDGHATAEAELWKRQDIQNGVLIILNRYLGGALIIDGKICEGNDFGCVIEHMTLAPDGPRCYCGKHGCFETFCSAYALERESKETPEIFFQKLRNGDHASGRIWKEFLRHLAVAINNIRMIIDCEFIIGGYLLQYMIPEDFEALQKLTEAECSIAIGNVVISPSRFESESAAQGAALSLVEEYLNGI